MNSLDWLTSRLPPTEKIPLRHEPDYYGASHLIAARLGKKTPPRSLVATWKHGWQFIEPVTHVRQVIHWGGPKDKHLVATEDLVRVLRRFGFTRATAVGMPFIYVDAMNVERKAGSLLVMPAHSLPYTDHNWSEQAYAEEIELLKARFSQIVVCVSQACVDHGYWTGAFDKVGIRWITGACIDDKNALLRMSALFRSFDYVTTNSIGSHVAYAAYSGCKVSIYGTLAQDDEKSAKNDPWYQRYPEVLKANVEGSREAAVRARYPEFFTLPSEAKERVVWGREMVGARFRKSPEELAKLLGWSATSQFAANGKDQLGRIKSALRRRAGRLFGAMRSLPAK